MPDLPGLEIEQEPVRQSVHVDCPIDEAFQLFTERVSEWWPLANSSVGGDDAESCEIEPWVGGRVLERTRSGQEHEWGSVTAWDPPGRLEFTWHPGAAPDSGQSVEVEFEVEADGTRITVIHTGWEFAGIQASALTSSFAHFVSELLLVA